MRTLQRIPARSWCEAVAVASGELFEFCLERGRADRFDVGDRAAAERREASAEDHAGVEQVGIGDDAIMQAAHRFIEHRQDQAILEIGWRLVILRYLGLDGAAVLPCVEALAVLFAALAGLDLDRVG